MIVFKPSIMAQATITKMIMGGFKSLRKSGGEDSCDSGIVAGDVVHVDIADTQKAVASISDIIDSAKVSGAIR